MFVLCSDKCTLTTEKERIARLMMSLNEPMVAPANHHAQPTQAYIFTVKEDKGFSVYVYLYLRFDKEGLLYRFDDEIRDAEGCRRAEEEAFQFAEDMGCLIDDMHFSMLMSEQQKKLLASIPLFMPKAEVITIPEPAAHPGAASLTEVEPEPVPVLQVVSESVSTPQVAKTKEQPEMILSKFRRRAMAERENRDVAEKIGRLMATV